MTINDKGLELIKKFEGCKLRAYKDIGGIPTIGYGHTGDEVFIGKIISQDEAEELLKDDLYHFEYGVQVKLKAPVTDNQFSALVSLAYNIGLGNFYKSTLIKKLNDEDYQGASDEFLRWNRVQGKVIQGLTNRRKAERDLFLL